MTIAEIQSMIAKGETRTLELKKSTGDLKDGMHSACAFLNTDGGWLVFGVTPNSLKIIGQQVNDSTRQEIANALAGLEPVVNVMVEYVDVPDAKNDEQVIVMHFDGYVWGDVPYTYHGCPYHKVESTTMMMPREMFEDRLSAAHPHKFAWERRVADGKTVDDLDEKRIKGAIRLGVENGRMPATALTETLEDVLGKATQFISV